MRLGAALQGNLREYMRRELSEATEGVVKGLHKAANSLKAVLRQQVSGAGLGRKVGNAWRNQFYENQRIDAAALVYSKAPEIHRAFNYGVTIRARGGKYLAIPAKVQKVGRFRRGVRNAGKLKFIPGQNGKNPLLVSEKKSTRKKVYGSDRKRRKPGQGLAPRTFAQRYKVEFILVPQTTLKKLLDVERAEQRILNALPAMIRESMKD